MQWRIIPRTIMRTIVSRWLNVFNQTGIEGAKLVPAVPFLRNRLRRKTFSAEWDLLMPNLKIDVSTDENDPSC